MADVVYKCFLAASTESVRYLRLAVFELPHSHSVFSINTPRMPPHTRSRGCEGAWTNLRIPHSSNIICIKWKSLLDTAKYIYYKKDEKDRGRHALARAVTATEVRKIRWMYICRILERCSVDRMIRGTSSFVRTAKTAGE